MFTSENVYKPYVVDVCEFKFVFVFIVKTDAVLIKEGHYGHFPPGRPQERDYHVEEPLLQAYK
jgi:hypothetical protein